MKNADDLFDLIHSLSPNEKRYFKLHAELQQGDKPYLTLFSQMAKMKTYNGDQLKVWWEKQGFNSPLNRVKNYLYNHLLKTLKNYHPTSIDLLLYEYLEAIEFLYSKSLFEQALKQLEKALKIAQEADSTLVLLKLKLWNIRLHAASDYKYLKPEEPEILWTNIEDQLNQVVLVTKLKGMLLIHNYHLRTASPQPDTPMQITEPALAELACKAQGFEMKRLINRCESWYHIGKMQLTECLEVMIQNIELYDDYPIRKKYEIREYGHLLENARIIAASVDDEALLKKIDQKIDQAEGLPKRQLETIILRRHYSSLLGLMGKNEHEKAFDKYKQEKDQIAQLIDTVDYGLRHAVIHMYMKLLHALGKYNEGLDWVRQMQADPTLKKDPVHLLLAGLYEMVLHFDLENYQLLESIIISYKRKATKHNYFDLLDKIIISGIAKCIQASSSSERKIIYKQMKDQVSAGIDTGEIQAEQLINLDILTWLESKIANTTIASMSREEVPA